MARLFVAVWPPEEVLDILEGLPRPQESGVRYTTRDQWHVTLRFLGEADESFAATAVERVRAGPADVVLGPRLSRLGRSVVVVPATGLDDLAAAVVAETADVGEPPDPRPFTGHVTLARLKRRGACRVAGAPVSARFRAREVHLVRSRLDPGGARYDTVTSVALSI